MPIEAITPQSAAEPSVSVAAPAQNQSSAVDEQPSEATMSDAANSVSSSGSGEASNQLSLDDFESLEDYAQALIENKQSAVSTQHSAEDAEETNAQAEQQPPAQIDGEEAEKTAEPNAHSGLDMDE